MLFYRWVIDPNILISYCISARLHELPALIEKYNLEFCGNEKLLAEFSSVISREKIKKYLSNEVDYYIEIISSFVSLYNIQNHFKGSPDANDDYLIDIVQQTNAVGLVTGDKALIKWQRAPVQIISWKDFQLTYPV